MKLFPSIVTFYAKLGEFYCNDIPRDINKRYNQNPTLITIEIDMTELSDKIYLCQNTYFASLFLFDIKISRYKL